MSAALALLLAVSIAACEDAPRAPEAFASIAEAARAVEPTLSLSLTPADCETPGRRVAPGEVPTPFDVAKDAYCGELVANRAAPEGFVTVFGSARLNEGTPEYESARCFGNLWTRENPTLPIASGGGPGLMEAANRGAIEAGGRSIGFSTHFAEKPNAFTTDAFLFSDFSVRERALFKYARAMVIYPGGFGTAWELFQGLSEMQTGKLKRMPLVLVGSEADWAPMMAYVEFMKQQGTISPKDLELLRRVETCEEAVSALGAVR